MSPIILYFLKVNIAIALFYAFYRLFFYKDTFFQWRRIVLLSFLAISFLYPFVNIQDWIKEQEPIAAITDIYTYVVLPEITITAALPPISTTELTTSANPINWHYIIIQASHYLYLTMAGMLFIRILLQFIGIIRLRFQTKAGYVQGIKIHLLSNLGNPFSFFKWIFIQPGIHTENELKEILTHEQTHARQWHSIDVIFGELVCIACWFNPFIWLIKREIRANLEYLADNKVLETGHDSKSYQYHLLGLTRHKQVATLYNNFNVLPLKNRIKMMNKKRTKQIGRAKYFLFPILTALLLIASNIDAVARTTEKVIREAMVEMITKPIKTVSTDMNIDQEDPVFETAHTMPQFTGGNEALMKFLNKTIKYPENAQKHNIQGRVIAQFIVNKDGSLSNLKIVRPIDPELDAESLRVIGEMPKWIPGKNKEGEIIRVRYTIPIVFRLQGGDKAVNSTTKNTSEDATKKPKANYTIVDNKKIYDIVEVMPQFPGELPALMKYLNENIKYPKEAEKEKIQGRTVIQFFVDEDGSIKNPVIARSAGNSLLDDEALRVIKTMPKWTPGKQDDKNVAVKYSLPIVFRLQ